MNKVKRAQFSIIFNDDVLYDQFVEPLKKAKELSDMVTKLLSVYYYSDEVRAVIDGFTIENDVDTNVNTKALDILSSAKDNLFMLGACINSADGSVEEGLRKMREYSETMGQSQDTSSPFGRPMLQLNLPESNKAKESSSQSETVESVSLEERVESLENNILDIKSLLQTVVASISTNQSSLLSLQSSSADNVNSSTLIGNSESSLQVEKESKDLQSTSGDTVETEKPVITTEETEDELDGDAILKSLLGSFNV